MIEFLGRLHPFLVHFPVALILAAAVAEALYMARKNRYYADAALFAVTAAAWVAFPAFLVGFAAASGQVFEADIERAFAVHRIAGIVTPMLAFLAAGMGHSTRRSGQVWEQMTYRLFLFLAAIAVLVAGAYGGVLVHGADYIPW
jgi:uncharacterized membrane protein